MDSTDARRALIVTARDPGLTKTERVLALALLDLVENHVLSANQAYALVNAFAIEAQGLVGFSRHDVMAVLRSALLAVVPCPSTPPAVPQAPQRASEGR